MRNSNSTSISICLKQNKVIVILWIIPLNILVEYRDENISWAHIVFPDNKNIIDCVENPRLGVFRLLNDEGIAPRGND